MKLKYFLRGLGLGILLTALVLCMRYRSGDSGKDVVEQARKLGMVFPEGTQEPPSFGDAVSPAEITAEVVSASPDKSAEKKPTDSPEPTIKNGAGVDVGESAKPEPSAETPTATPSASPTKKPDSGSRKTKTFTVRGGLLSSSVSRELREAGIIKDSKAFDAYLEEHGYSQIVRAGTYKIPLGVSYEELAKIITRTK